MMPPLAIETHELRKEYGPLVAVESLDLTIEAGEAFGFLGPNGAGKTTSLKMLLDLVHPTSGSASLFGVPTSDSASRRRVGFLPEHFVFHDWLHAQEFLDIHGRLHQVPAEVRKQRIPLLLERVGLLAQAHRPLGTFSKGMLQRVGLAQALIGDPDIVFLDEPTSGLDPLGRRMVRDLIRDLKQQGKTIFLNSHLLGEVEVTCTRVAFVSHGRVLDVADLSDYQSGLLQVSLKVDRVDQGLVEGLQQWGDSIEVDGSANTVTMRVPDESVLPAVARWIVGRGTALYQLAPRTISLEDLFVSIVGAEAP